jgi:hypothetical protein
LPFLSFAVAGLPVDLDILTKCGTLLKSMSLLGSNLFGPGILFFSKAMASIIEVFSLPLE